MGGMVEEVVELELRFSSRGGCRWQRGPIATPQMPLEAGVRLFAVTCSCFRAYPKRRWASPLPPPRPQPGHTADLRQRAERSHWPALNCATRVLESERMGPHGTLGAGSIIDSLFPSSSLPQMGRTSSLSHVSLRAQKRARGLRAVSLGRPIL